MKNFLKKNNKRIFSGALILTLLFGSTNTLLALTMADLEFLISIGVIPADQADFARQAVGAVNQEGIGSAVKINPDSELECLILNQNLVKGNKGTVVVSLQKFLQRLGHFPKNESTSGLYGDITVKAVSDFQLAKGLITSSAQLGAGAVGPITRAKIQEVSCNQVSNENNYVEPVVAPAPAPTTQVTAPVFQAPAEPYVKPELSLKAFTTYQDAERGVLHFRYDMSFLPKKSVKYFDITLVCAPGTVLTNRDDLKECGQTLRLKASTQGKKSIKIGFTSLVKSFQTIGLGVEAVDENDKTLDFAEVINELPAPKPVTYLNQTLADGSLAKYGIPQARLCDPNEQLEFIKYTMTVYQDSKSTIVPPTCWPGDIRCDFDVNYPPTYCQIQNGPNSNDLCPSSERFFNGKCVSRV